MRLTLQALFFALLPVGVLAQTQPGTLVPWGILGPSLQQTAPTGGAFTQAAGGEQHCLALRSNGSLAPWGDDRHGQVSNTPTGTGFTQVAAGANHCLALRSDGSIASWGRDSHLQVSNTPTGTGFTQVVGAIECSLALRSDGSIVAFGGAWSIYPGGVHPMVSGAPSVTGFTQLAAGVMHALALRSNGSIVSWGFDNSGVVSNTPTGTDFVQVAGGLDYSLALRSDGSIVAWGDSLTPAVNQTPTGTGFTQVAAGGLFEAYSLALRTDGSIAGWGSNMSGGLPVPPVTGFTQLATTIRSMYALALHGPNPAAYTPFGSGCRGTMGVPSLAAPAGSLPRIGEAFTTTVSSLGSSSVPFGLLGGSNTSWRGLSLPLDLTSIGMPSCNIHVSVELSMALAVSGNNARWDLPIPYVTSLLGQSLYQQAFVIDPGANPLGAVVSNAGTARIGF